MLPLSPRAMGRILERQLEQKFKNLVLNNHAVSSFEMTTKAQLALMDHVEFQTWYHRGTEQSLFTFSPNGASGMTFLIPILTSKLMTCWSDRIVVNKTMTSRWVLDVPSSNMKDMHATTMTTTAPAASFPSAASTVSSFSLSSQQQRRPTYHLFNCPSVTNEDDAHKDDIGSSSCHDLCQFIL